MAGKKGKGAKSGSRSLSDHVAEIQQQVETTGSDEHEAPKLDPQVEAEVQGVSPEDTQKHFSGLISELQSYAKALQDSVRKSDASRKKYEEMQAEIKGKKEQIEKDKKQLNTDKEELKRFQEKVAEKDNQQVTRERELEEREINARAGFVQQNETALAELKQEVIALEEQRKELKACLQKDEADAKSKLDEDLQKLAQQAEESIGKKKIELEQQKALLDERKRSVDVSVSRLASQRSQFEERKKLLEDEVATEYQEKLNQKDRQLERLQRLRAKDLEGIEQLENELDGLSEIRRMLNEQRPVAFLDKVHNLEQSNRDLLRKLEEKPTDDLVAKNQDLSEQNYRLENQLKDKEMELNAKIKELSANRQSILEHECLAQENFVLKQHKVSLGAHITDLESRLNDLIEKQQGSKIFESLWEMDSDRTCQMKPALEDVPRLDAFAHELQQMIASTYPGTPLYYREQDIRLFLAGLAMSKLHILQGISGTGKTSLAKAFARVMGGSCTDIAVQAGWRDRDDLLGHFNAFERKYYSKETLKALYRARTPGFSDRINIVLLDEMNLSRPEQYFAEFLSAIEKQPEDRRIVLLDNTDPNPPKLMLGGNSILVPDNVWFIGTANHDETTNEFADKTYDRSHVMELPRHEEKFKIKPHQKCAYKYSSLKKRFDDAINDYDEQVNKLIDELTHSHLTKVMASSFDIGWGNRLERHARQFIPVVLACGGNTGEALDHLLATKVFRAGKVTGRFDTEEKDLKDIESALEDVWLELDLGSEPLKCLHLIKRDLRRKESGE